MPNQYITYSRKIAAEIMQISNYYIPYLFKRGKALIPNRVDFELTYKCNLRCQFCPQELFKTQVKNGEKPPSTLNEMKTPEICGIMDELKGGGVPLVTLTGGEPFVRKDIMQIVRHAKSSGFALSILSNGALINEEKAFELVELGVDTITFSLDGDGALHDKLRGVSDTYSKLKKAVRYLTESRKKANKKRPYINFNCTISALNQNKLEEIMDSAISLGVDSVSFGFLFFTNEKAVEKTASILPIQQVKQENQVLPYSLQKVDIEILKRQIKICKEKAEKAGLPISFNPHLRHDEIKEYFYNYDYSYTNKCFFPWNVARINPEGIVYPCSIDVKMGDLKEKNFFDIWNGGDYVNFRKALKKKKLFPKCNKCCELQSKVWSLLP